KQEAKTEEDVKRVVQMLIRDKHTSPLECVVMTFLYQDKNNFLSSWGKESLDKFRHAVVHEVSKTPNEITWMITINFHALSKYRNKHIIFEQLYQKVKEEGFLKYAIEQLE